MPLPARGSITLEILIAFAILSVVLASVILLLYGSNATALAHEREELKLAKDALSGMRTASAADFFSITASTSDTTLSGTSYHEDVSVVDLTPCVKSASATVAGSGAVGDAVSLSQWFPNLADMRALGGDCAVKEPAGDWKGTESFASADVSDATGTAIDVVGGIAYVGLSTPPYLAMFDVSGSQIPFSNGFSLGAAPSALDAVMLPDAEGTVKRYVFAAIASSTEQLKVVEVSDSHNPVLLASKTLLGVHAATSDAYGRRVLYYDHRVYVTNWFISGPQSELHIFNADTPGAPIEIGTGTSLETTVNDFAIREQNIDNAVKRFLYAATTHDQKELALYDVTNSSAVSGTPVAAVDLPGGQDGESLALVGNRLYFGRASNTAGPELYVFDITDPLSMPVLGTGEVTSKDVSRVIVSGTRAYLAATLDGTPSTRRFEAWDVSDGGHPFRLFTHPLSGMAVGGIDYDGEEDALFAVSASNPLLSLFRSL